MHANHIVPFFSQRNYSNFIRDSGSFFQASLHTPDASALLMWAPLGAFCPTRRALAEKTLFLATFPEKHTFSPI